MLPYLADGCVSFIRVVKGPGIDQAEAQLEERIESGQR